MDERLRIAIVERRTAGNDASPTELIRYQLSDHLRSSMLELAGDGSLISYEEYYPFGETSYQSVRSQLEAPKRYRYTAMERDEESALTYHGARYCAPWLGRWIALDPAGT